MKKVLIVISLLFVMVLLSSCLLTIGGALAGLGDSTSNDTTEKEINREPETTEAFTYAPVTVQEPKTNPITTERKEKNGFDSATKTTYSFYGIKIKVPSYFSKDSSSKEDQLFLYAEYGAGETLISLMGTESSYNRTEFENKIDYFLNAFYERIFSGENKGQLISSGTVFINGKKCGQNKFKGTFSGKSLTGSTVIVYVDSKKCTVMITLLQSDKSTYIYDSDFEKIIKTIEWDTTKESQDTSSGNSDKIRPSVKEMIDSYEAFVDEYCAFMASYNPTDFSQMSKYLDLLQKEIDMTKNFEKMEKDLNTVELLYYTEVSLRCAQKMLNATTSILD